jgi:serine/threonine-protein kinase
MAPEQFVGQPASVQSDLYALGLVLYEIFTGKPAFSGATVGELATMHRERTPSSVTSLVSDLDPAVERTIQRCLEKDPALRPASALAVSASLPGGDPLAAAIARGETPSPELVAAAGSTGLVTPAFALGGLALALIALVVVVLITGVLHPVLLSPLAKSPDVLRNDASLIVRAFGDTHTPADTSSGFAQSFYFAQLRTEPAATRRAHLRLGQPAAFVFWYRQSAHAALSADNFGSNSRVSPNSPPMTEAGMIAVDLDTQGRLLQFLAVPSQDDRGAAPAPAPDWTVAFAKAGLDPARFVPVTPRWVPPVYADTRAAWDGVYPERPDIALHVEAAAAHGQLVYFEMLGPWRQPIRDVPVQSASRWFQVVLVPLVFLSLLVTAFLLTVRNLHLGRGDRRGAFRIAGFVVAMVGSAGVLGSDLQPTPGGVFGVALLAAAQALLIGVCAWIGYIALEPYVRRRWPQTLIGWSRLIGGRWRDPLVGRDVLAGVLVALALQVPSFLLDLAGATDTTTSYPVWMLDGLRFTAAWICTQAASLVLVGIGMLFAFLLLTVVVRRGWIAGAIVVAFLAASAVAQGANPLLDAATAVIAVGMLVVCMVRLGLLATIVVMLVENLTSVAPFTFDPSRWYAADSYLVIGVIVALAVFGAWTSANLRPAVKRMMGD